MAGSDVIGCTKGGATTSVKFIFISNFCRAQYRRLWLFSAPRQLGAYYCISAYIITVTRPGLLSACALNRMLRLEHV